VIVLTAVDCARPAVEALRMGAQDFLVKPADPTEIARAVAHAESLHVPRKDGAAPDVECDGRDSGLIGCSPQMRIVRRLIPALARSRESVLILGETGTGKELLARAVHAQGPRRHAPFVAHNMAATPADLAETIFFGHVRGAFSGATSDHAGLFEQAHGGTLFLDEIDSFPPPLQAKLLRVLEGGSVQRIGSGSARTFDVRVIAASATDLSLQVDAGAFRADLYYRLKQLEVMLPPLRDRIADIPALVRHFLAELSGEFDSTPDLDRAALDQLMDHRWPGNVRELRNVVRAAAVVAGAGPIGLEHLPRGLRPDARKLDTRHPGSLRFIEIRHILETLDRVGGNRSEAARILGIDRGTLARKLAAGKPIETRDTRRS